MMRSCWGLLLLGAIASGPAAARAQIDLPDDCNYTAVEPGVYSAETACARQLERIGRAFRHSPLWRRCDANIRTDFSRILSSGYQAHRLKFLPLGGQRFLLAVACNQGAYNASYLFFTYQDQPRSATPKVLLFPEVKDIAGKARIAYTPLVFMREFDPESRTLYHYAKTLGDGTGGDYAEYLIDARRFTPRLKTWISKHPADSRSQYQFEKGQRPQASGWQPYAGEADGCLAAPTAFSGACR